jgi:hypothetical protein
LVHYLILHYREEHLPKLLECIRFPYIDASELVKIPLAYPVIGRCELFGSLLQEALHFQVKFLWSFFWFVN